jgi:hypothetical protein
MDFGVARKPPQSGPGVVLGHPPPQGVAADEHYIFSFLKKHKILVFNF